MKSLSLPLILSWQRGLLYKTLSICCERQWTPACKPLMILTACFLSFSVWPRHLWYTCTHRVTAMCRHEEILILSLMTQTVWKLRKLWECIFLCRVDCIGYWLRQGIENLFLLSNQLHLKKKVILIKKTKKKTTELNGSFCIPTATKYHNCYKYITQQQNHWSMTAEQITLFFFFMVHF